MTPDKISLISGRSAHSREKLGKSWSSGNALRSLSIDP
jgi:hypothetical protein